MRVDPLMGEQWQKLHGWRPVGAGVGVSEYVSADDGEGSRSTSEAWSGDLRSKLPLFRHAAVLQLGAPHRTVLLGHLQVLRLLLAHPRALRQRPPVPAFPVQWHVGASAARGGRERQGAVPSEEVLPQLRVEVEEEEGGVVVVEEAG